MSFTFDRETAAIQLAVSTRTLDRYVKSSKIRSKKIGKKVFLNDADVAALKVMLEGEASKASVEGEVVITETVVEKRRAPKASQEENSSEGEIVFYPDSSEDTGFRKRSLVDYKDLFEDAQKRIAEKDRVIQELSFRAGKAEAELNNSISLIEYKKTALLLEGAKAKTESDEKIFQEKLEGLQKEMKREKMVSAILMSAVALLLIATALIWFFSI